MASQAQLAANTANAQHSTGPRTAEGKTVAAQNSRKHGLTSKDLVIALDEQPEFESLRDSLTADITPQGELELLQFDLLLHAAWNLHRIRKREASLVKDDLDPILDPAVQKDAERLALYYSRTERSYYRALRELRSLQTSRAVHAGMIPSRQAVTPIRADAAVVHRYTHNDDRLRLNSRPAQPATGVQPVEYSSEDCPT